MFRFLQRSANPPPRETRAGRLPAGYLSTAGRHIVDSGGEPVRLAGINWYGFDCTAMIAGGLDRRPLTDLCRQIAGFGFNHIRLPLCVQLVQENPIVEQGLEANSELRGKHALDIVDAIIAAVGREGLRVVLDSHRLDAGWSTQENGLWYTQTYPEAAWLESWLTMVRRYSYDATVIGCDLHNEPGAPAPRLDAWPGNGGSLWGYEDPTNRTGFAADWAAAAERAGDAIHEINPQLLIFVEGVRYDPAGPRGNNGVYWPGGNLTGVAQRGGQRRGPRSIELRLPNKLVYSVHDYGPDMYGGLPWCQQGTTAQTSRPSEAVWDRAWGFLVKESIAPVWIGEFGTPNGYRPGDTRPAEMFADPGPDQPQGSWFSYLLDYAHRNDISWSYWCLNGTQSLAPGRNPARPDWYGLLDPTWSKPVEPLLHRLQAAM